MFPKPIPREKKRKAKTWERPRRLDRPGSDPGRLEFCRSLPCLGAVCFPGHVCSGPVEASHLRAHTGLSRKEPDRKTAPKCSALHRDWERRRGVFDGWDNDRRFLWMTDRINETNLLWDALADLQREWWQGQAEIARRRRAEALRG
jgi:hypothetical protein